VVCKEIHQSSGTEGLYPASKRIAMSIREETNPSLKGHQGLNREFSKEKEQKASKYMKCSTSLAQKEMQIKATLRFHLTPVRMAIIKGNNNKYVYAYVCVVFSLCPSSMKF
jgi:hypothetical protein